MGSGTSTGLLFETFLVAAPLLFRPYRVLLLCRIISLLPALSTGWANLSVIVVEELLQFLCDPKCLWNALRNSNWKTLKAS